MTRNRWIVQVANGRRPFVTIAEHQTFFRGWMSYASAFDVHAGTAKRLIHVRGQRARTILEE